MKYVLLIHSDMALWEQLPKEEADRVIGNHYKLMDELKASGEMIRVDGLSNERTFIEFRDGSPAVTDGPFGEVKEQLAGVFAVDVDSFERAKEIAGPDLRIRRGRDPGADGGRRDGDVTTDFAIEDLLRQLAPQVLAALTRRHGQFDLCEDAVQEALLAAAQQWPTDGIPDNPRGWLITVASRRLLDQMRGDAARQRRETAAIALMPPEAWQVPAPDAAEVAEHEDDALTLLFMCCHPSLSPASQLALTLRAVGGLTTAQIASAFLVPEATMAQRISRAKATIRTAGARFEMPPETERTDRLRVVLHVLYLIFNEGYTASSGDDLQRPELAARGDPHHPRRPSATPRGRRGGRSAGTHVADRRAPRGPHQARREPRAASGAGPLPLGRRRDPRGCRPDHRDPAARDDRAVPAPGRDRRDPRRGRRPPRTPTGRRSSVSTRLLEQVSPNPMITLNHAVAAAMVNGPEAGLRMLAPLETDERIAHHHRLEAVRGHLLEMAGERDAARTAYRLAARRTTSLPERRYLEGKAARLAT